MKCMMQDNFNSIKVRLKQESEQYPIDEHHDFNSIKVRLKHTCNVTYAKVRGTFQFHKGTIKTHLKDNIHH